MADDLDSIVKGAPMPGREAAAKNVSGTSAISSSSTTKAGDPLSHTPSNPSMIYLNLLILEASLRAQYLELRARRRHHSFFLALLTLWILGFGYALFFAPREDGRGVGGSVYWVVEVAEKVCFMGGVITAVLVWATGIWDRGVRWPRRWFAISNRGLRGFNCKLVIMKRHWWAEILSTVVWFLTYGVFSNTGGSSYRYVDPSVLREVDKELSLSAQSHPTLPVVTEDEERGVGGGTRVGHGLGHEEDLAPGGDYVKLLLLAKPFSPTFRENWELYRAEYWDRENERRRLIRAKLKEHDRRLRRQRGGWFWWLPWYRTEVERRPVNIEVAAGHKAGPSLDAEKAGLLHPRHAAVEREHRRTRSNSGSVRRGSMSGTSAVSGTPSHSRSTTPTIELEEGGAITRKTSTASNASDKRRKKTSLSSGSQRQKQRPVVESRSVTPEITSPLAKESSSAGSGSVAEEAARRPRKSVSRSPAPSTSSRD